MKRSGLLLSLCLVFGSGVLVGALGYRLYSTELRQEIKTEKQEADSPDDWRRTYVESITARLALTDEQVAQLNQILDDTKARIHALDQEAKGTDGEVADETPVEDLA